MSEYDISFFCLYFYVRWERVFCNENRDVCVCVCVEGVGDATILRVARYVVNGLSGFVFFFVHVPYTMLVVARRNNTSAQPDGGNRHWLLAAGSLPPPTPSPSPPI